MPKALTLQNHRGQRRRCGVWYAVTVGRLCAAQSIVGLAHPTLRHAAPATGSQQLARTYAFESLEARPDAARIRCGGQRCVPHWCVARLSCHRWSVVSSSSGSLLCCRARGRRATIAAAQEPRPPADGHFAGAACRPRPTCRRSQTRALARAHPRGATAGAGAGAGAGNRRDWHRRYKRARPLRYPR